MAVRVLVTGANGFIGRAVCTSAVQQGHGVRGALRTPQELPAGVESIVVGNVDGTTDWAPALSQVEVVVHLAARAHITRDRALDPLAEFRKTNVEGTLHLAQQAVAAGVRRFIFISSIAVHGQETRGAPFTADSPAAAQAPHAQSKHEAEVALQELAARTGLEVVILRPPLVYGPQVPGNFASLMRVLSRRLPLPLGAVTQNRRSLVALDNLVDLILVCMTHPAAKNQSFLVCDGEDLSTAELLRRLGHALGQPARLWPLPPRLLQWGARLFGQRDALQSLLGSLQIDSTKTQTLLGWTPSISVDEGLRRAAQKQVNEARV